MPAPIAYQKIRTSTGIVDIPIYSIIDYPNSPVRVATPTGIGCYNLVAPTNDHPIRIVTNTGIMGINQIVVSEEEDSIIDFNNYNLVGVDTILEEDTVDYMLMHTDSNGNGLGLPFTANVGDTLNVSLDVDIIQGVDDVVSARLWNLTQNKWITTNFKTGTQTSGIHNLSNTFTLTASNLNNGDQLELRIVQSWKNSTHDDFKFKVMKTSVLSIL
jgi:hypothetical protein